MDAETQIKLNILRYTGGDLKTIKYPISLSNYIWLFYRKIVQQHCGADATQDLTQEALEAEYLRVSNYGGKYKDILPIEYIHHNMKIEHLQES